MNHKHIITNTELKCVSWYEIAQRFHLHIVVSAVQLRLSHFFFCNRGPTFYRILRMFLNATPTSEGFSLCLWALASLAH